VESFTVTAAWPLVIAGIEKEQAPMVWVVAPQGLGLQLAPR
jgi:hypothetical protein